MKFRIPPPAGTRIPAPKGTVGSRIKLERKAHRDAEPECLQERVFESNLGNPPTKPQKRAEGGKEWQQQPLETQTLGSHPMAGVALGFTLPGPRNSFVMARIDAWCSLPCPNNSDEAIQATFVRASKLVQEQLADDAGTAQEFIDALTG